MIKLLAKAFIKDYKNYEDNEVRGRYTILCGIIGVICNVLFSTFKVVVGLLSGSIALVSDGVNNIGDVATSLVSIVSAKFANKKADKEHPFGHGRYEYVAALVVAFLILFVAFELLLESIDRIKNPVTVTANTLFYVILIVSVLVKVWICIFNHTYGKKLNVEVLKATSVDAGSDAIVTTAILIATIIGKYLDFPVDGVAGIVVSVLVGFNGVKVARSSIGCLLGEAPDPKVVDKLKSIISEDQNVLGIHDLMIHNYGPNRYFASVHAEVDERGDVVKIHEAIDKIEADVLRRLNIHLTIHMDPISMSPIVQKHKEIVIKAIKAIDADLDIHDFRLVDGVDQINLIFDLVVPYSYDKHKRMIIEEEITKALALLDHRYKLVMTIENQYS